MDNFNFNRDFYEACKALGERDGGRLAFALLCYGYEGEVPDKLPAALSAAFTLAKGRVDAMVSGSRGGKRGVSAKAAKSEQSPTQDPTQDPTQPPSQPPTQDPGQPPRHDPRQQKEKEKEKEIKEEEPNGSSKKAPRFKAPSAEEVEAYAADYAAGKGWGSPAAVGFDAERFVDFYASKGWKVGTSPMRDWKAAVRGWIVRGRKEGGNDGRFDAYA